MCVCVCVCVDTCVCAHNPPTHTQTLFLARARAHAGMHTRAAIHELTRVQYGRTVGLSGGMQVPSQGRWRALYPQSCPWPQCLVCVTSCVCVCVCVSVHIRNMNMSRDGKYTHTHTQIDINTDNPCRRNRIPGNPGNPGNSGNTDIPFFSVCVEWSTQRMGIWP